MPGIFQHLLSTRYTATYTANPGLLTDSIGYGPSDGGIGKGV
jgi:hypothetical protein